MLNCGDTFLAGNNDSDDDFHLRIIVTPPNQGEVIVVCVVTAHKRSESLVVLNKGDHSFIKHESVVAYIWSEIRSVADIEAAIDAGVAKKREPIDNSILTKIQGCLLESMFTPNGVRHYFKSVMGL